MVTNQKHIYPILQDVQERKKRVIFAMPHYITFNLAMYTNHILQELL